MQVIARGIVGDDKQGTALPSCTFPQVCILPSGRWLCGFRAAPHKAAVVGQRALLAYSDDEGSTWSKPLELFVPPSIEGRPGVFRSVAFTALSSKRVLATLCWVDCSHPSLPFFNEDTEGLLDTRIFLAWSNDEGNTWTKPELLNTTPFNCPTPITGPVLALANGDLACQFELNKSYYEPTAWRHASVLMFSRSGGETWEEHAIVSSDPENRLFFWDQRPGILPGGRILDLFWTFDRKHATYRNIHACESVDHGRTWSTMWDTGLAGQPAPPVPLADGGLGMVYVDREGAPQIKMRSSCDGGRTWPKASEILIEHPQLADQNWEKSSLQDAWSEMTAFSLGLPSAAVTASGDVVVVYYSGSSTDQTVIKWARIRTAMNFRRDCGSAVVRKATADFSPKASDRDRLIASND